MPSDLTERLAAKLREVGVVGFYCHELAKKAPQILPLLLSEPELVAGLAPEVRLSVLTPRERAVIVAGEKALAIDDAQRSLKSPGFKDFGELTYQLQIALAEARALAPSPATMEGTNDE